MKKLLLPASITALILIGCSDDKNEQAEKVVKKTEQAVTKKVEEVIDSSSNAADQAESAFKAVSTGVKKYYDRMIASQPLIQSFDYDIESYEKGAEESKAVTKASVKFAAKIFEGSDHIDVKFNHVIKHGSAEKSAGYIAKIQSSLIDHNMTDKFKSVIDNVSYTTDIKTDESVQQLLKVSAFNTEDDGAQIAVSDMTFDFKSNLKDISGGYGDFDGKLSGLKVTEYEETVFEMMPFDFNGYYKPSGDFEMKNATPLTIKAEETNILVNKLNANGNMQFNEKYGMGLGKINYALSDIELSGGDLPMPVKINSVTINSDSKIDGQDIFSQSGNIQIVPEAGLIGQLSGGMVNISQADINFNIDKLPASIMLKYRDMMKNIVQDLEEEEALAAASDDTAMADPAIDADVSMKSEAEMEKAVTEMFNSAKAAGAELGFNVDVKADEGSILLNAKSNLISDSTVTIEQIKEAQSPADLFNLININADATVPAILLEKTGAQMMAGPFIKKEGDVYKSTIVTKDGQLLINDIPAPL